MKIICLVNNFYNSKQEKITPYYFIKPDTALLRNNSPFYIPDFTKEVFFEVELVLRINKLGKNISEQFAHRYYNEIGIGIDFTAHDVLMNCKQLGLPWETAKGFDYSAPVGNQFINKNEFANQNNISFNLTINDIPVQQSNTNDMVYSFNKAISFVSQYMTLRTGDLLFMGTPPGSAAIKPGDHLMASIENKVLLDFVIR
jgi:acylpyruvate hydrolase